MRTETLAVRRLLPGIVAAAVLALGGCVAGGGYDDGYVGGGVDVDYGVGYYGPCCGYDYGGWGHRWGGPPPRGGFPRGTPRPNPAYRPAAPSRSMPSIPSHHR